jgi:hypothetical protein
MNQRVSDENLLEKEMSISVQKVSVYDFVQLLQKEYFIPLSFIDADEMKEVTIDLKEVSLKAVLEEIVSQAPIYQFRVVNERLVLYPTLLKYQLAVRDISIKATKRLDAANEYVSQLTRQFPEFANLVGPPMFGNPQHPVFSDPVSVEGGGTVLEQFVQLLGDNLRIMFLVIKAKSGVPVLTFKEV